MWQKLQVTHLALKSEISIHGAEPGAQLTYETSTLLLQKREQGADLPQPKAPADFGPVAPGG